MAGSIYLPFTAAWPLLLDAGWLVDIGWTSKVE
jgi:hypothetical protein